MGYFVQTNKSKKRALYWADEQTSNRQSTKLTEHDKPLTNTWEQRQGNWAVHSRGDIMNNETREFRLDTTDTRPGTKAIKQETQHKTVTRTCRLDTGIKVRHGDKTQVRDPWSDCGKQRNCKTKYYKTQKKKQNVNGATRDIINIYTRQR